MTWGQSVFISRDTMLQWDAESLLIREHLFGTNLLWQLHLWSYRVGTLHSMYYTLHKFLQEDTGLGGGGGGGGNPEGAPKKDFGAIPFFLVIANYEKAFLYVALG